MTTAYEWTFRLTVAWTGIIAGFMISYVIVIGRFFNWLLRHNRYDVFTDAYSVFRKQDNPVTPYIAFVFTHLLLSLLLVGLSFATSQVYWWTFMPLLCVPLFLTIHFGSPFGQAEKQVNSGQAEDATAVRNYLKFNIPLHLLYAIIFSTALIILLTQPSIR